MNQHDTALALRNDVLARRTNVVGRSPYSPRFSEADTYKLKATVYKRLRIILRSNGCSHPTCTMCPLPNEAIRLSSYRVSAKNYVEQIRSTIESNDPCEMLCIYNDGSFFSSHELPMEARQQIYRLVRESGCRYLMVESLPVFITRSVLNEARTFLKDVRLAVGVGIQSFDEEIRRLCIASPVQMDDFLNAHHLLRKFNCDTKTYLLLKPPFLTEDEAIADCISSAHQLNELLADDITICPTRVAHNTVVSRLYELGAYVPPALMSVVDVLRAIPVGCNARVSVFNVHSSDMQAAPPLTCDGCRERTLNALLAYNIDPSTAHLENLHCAQCRAKARACDGHWRNLKLQDRVQMYLQSEHHSPALHPTR
jgi:radical SAM enzyme (TIGR01210 family)